MPRAKSLAKLQEELAIFMEVKLFNFEQGIRQNCCNPFTGETEEILWNRTATIVNAKIRETNRRMKKYGYQVREFPLAIN